LDAELTFLNLFQERLHKIDQFLDQYFDAVDLPNQAALENFRSAIRYSVNSGGKRFRPLLALLVGEVFNTPEDRIMPWAAAVEFIHTYSLIHDDLPCMDNDDLRRGKPTNHKVFGQALALLAGDALLTESFYLVSEVYSDQPELARRLVSLLSLAAGARGMVGGQVLDMHYEKNEPSFEELLTVHRMKTAQLIQVPLQGAGWICGAEESKIDVLRKFGEVLGLAFQVADDILDHDQSGQDNRSFTKLIGFSESKNLLVELSEEALFHLKKINTQSTLLHQMIEFNLLRRA
jgi:geranylgeranyl diphosphate synthase type II